MDDDHDDDDDDEEEEEERKRRRVVMIYDHHYHPSVFGLWLDLSPGPSLPVDYITDYAGGPIFALARSSKVEPGPPNLGPLMKLRKFDRCALEAIIAYRSYSRCLELKLGSKAQFMGLMQGVFMVQKHSERNQTSFTVTFI